jgi:AhpC/TSA family
MPCRHHLGEVADHIDKFRKAGCEVLVVTQATPEMLTLFLDRHPQPFPVVCDPERAAYRAFGLERTSWWTFLRPTVLWGYLKLMVRGERVRQPYDGDDGVQSGRQESNLRSRVPETRGHSAWPTPRSPAVPAVGVEPTAIPFSAGRSTT